MSREKRSRKRRRRTRRRIDEVDLAIRRHRAARQIRDPILHDPILHAANPIQIEGRGGERRLKGEEEEEVKNRNLIDEQS